MDNTTPLTYSFEVHGDDFSSAGEASVQVKKILRSIGFDAETIRRVSIAMYEAEINMVIHANGGIAELYVYPDKIVIVLTDKGPGIADIDLAMSEGYSTAPENVHSLGFGAGMGLPNIKKYSDDLVIDSKLGEGTKLTITVIPQR